MLRNKHAVTWMNLKIITMKEARKKEYIQYNFIYTKFLNVQINL